MIEIAPGVRYKFGSAEHAVVKMALAYRHGMTAEAATCYALVGELIRRNEALLAASPDSYVQLYQTASGRVAHAALWHEGAIHHDPTDIAGEDRLPEYHLGPAFPVVEFLALMRRLDTAPDGSLAPTGFPVPAAPARRAAVG